MKIRKQFLTKNRCYQIGATMKPVGLVVHSTGANNPNTERYTSVSGWNNENTSKCVHAFIGLNQNDKLEIVQTLPLNMQCWGCGSGSKGSYNRNHIQFEICEDSLDDKKYFNQIYNAAVEFSAYLCVWNKIKAGQIVDHSEAHSLGYASNHSDISHWFNRFDKSMADFRKAVKKTKKSLKTVTVKKSGKLTCRKEKSKLSKSMGKFKNGTSLVVLKAGKKWTNVTGVRLDGSVIEGYCLTKYLK